jgi:hypothetical protein
MNSLSLKTIKNTWQKSLTILDNHYVNLSLVIVLILYSSQIFGNINIIISNLYQYSFVKLLVLLIIAYVGPKDTNIAVLLAISYVISLRNNKNSYIENFYQNRKKSSELKDIYLPLTLDKQKQIMPKTTENCIKIIDTLANNNTSKVIYFGLNMKDNVKNSNGQEYVNIYNYFMECLMYLISNSDTLENKSKCYFILAGEYFGVQAKLINFTFNLSVSHAPTTNLTGNELTYYNNLNDIMNTDKKPKGVNNRNIKSARAILSNSLIINNFDKKFFGLKLDTNSKSKNHILYNYCFETLLYILANQDLFNLSAYASALKIIGTQSKSIGFIMIFNINSSYIPAN